MKHLFVPYELAVKLKELGFNEPVIAGYDVDDFKLCSIVNESGILSGVVTHSLMSVIAAPMYQQVVDWFREKHDTVINVYANASGYCFEFHDSAKKGGTHRYDSDITGPNDSGCWDDYYEAFSAAIEESLKLIKP